MAAEDTEITLGAGKLLGLFLMLAATCGIFFAVGYSLGKTSAREQALNSHAALVEKADAATESGKGTTASANPSAVSNQAEPGKESSPDLTFYNSVKQNPRADSNAGPKLNVEAPGLQKASGSPAPNAVVRTAATESATGAAKPESSAAPAMPLPETTTSGAYLVQIAAVSHEEDAAALAGALRKKSYAASVVNNPSGKDKLFHVVLGPYASLQDAQLMKTKLEAEGYNPIVKR